MSLQFLIPSTLLIIFSATVSADGLFLDGLEDDLGLTESLSASYAQDLTPKYHQFSGGDCDDISRQPFTDNGLSSGQRSIHCSVTEYGSGKIESYFQSAPDGSYSTGISWTFD